MGEDGRLLLPKVDMPKLVWVARITNCSVGYCPCYLSVESALWGPFDLKCRPLQLTEGYGMILSDKVITILLILGE